MIAYSNDKNNKNAIASYKQHLVYEVATSLADSKHIAEDYNNAYRYQHRAQIHIVGHATLRPYDPIYLDGLPNGLSGYWTVISIKHVFGGSLTKYMMHVEVGTDIVGDSDDFAKYRSDTRDIQSELSGQSLALAETSLSEYSVSPNSSSVEDLYTHRGSSAVSESPVDVPNIPDVTTYSNYVPNLTNVKNIVKWTSKSSGRVIK